MSVAFPGYVPDVHSSDALDPAWGNAIRDRSNQVFADTTTRDAAIPAPQVGQTCVITTGSNAGEYCYVGATDAWRPNWNQGWGEVARTVDVTLQTNADSAEHTITAAATAMTAVANRLYRITVSGIWTNLRVGAASIVVKVKDGTTLIEQARSGIAAASVSLPLTFSVETTLTAGAHTINVTHQQSTSVDGLSMPGATTPLVITIDDIGPSGAPS